MRTTFYILLQGLRKQRWRICRKVYLKWNFWNIRKSLLLYTIDLNGMTLFCNPIAFSILVNFRIKYFTKSKTHVHFFNVVQRQLIMFQQLWENTVIAPISNFGLQPKCGIIGKKVPVCCAINISRLAGELVGFQKQDVNDDELCSTHQHDDPQDGQPLPLPWSEFSNFS